MSSTPVRPSARALTCPDAPARVRHVPRFPPAQLRPARHPLHLLTPTVAPDTRVCPGAPTKPRPTRRQPDHAHYGAAARELEFEAEAAQHLRAPPRLRRFKTLRRDLTPPRTLNFEEAQCPPAPQRPRALKRTPFTHLALTDADFE